MKNLIGFHLFEKWEHMPTVDQLNAMPAMKDKWSGVDFKFVPIIDRGTGARKLELTKAFFERRGDHYTFYPNRHTIEDYRHMIMRQVDLETPEDWNNTIKRMVNYMAASQLNCVLNENDEEVTFSSDYKRTYNQNKIEELKKGIGIEKLVDKQVLWDDPATRSIIFWVMPNIVPPLNNLLQKGILLNYESILNNIRTELPSANLSSINIERAKKLTKGYSILQRNSTKTTREERQAKWHEDREAEQRAIRNAEGN